MANSKNYNYENLDRPYNNNMQRSDDSDPTISSIGTDNNGDTVSSSSASSTSGSSSGSGSSGDTESSIPTVTPDNLEDIWVKSFIKSSNYKPKSQGFLLDGLKGYIECMKLFVGNGGIIGGSLDIPDTTTANSFHVDNQGNIWSGSTTFATAPFSVTNTGDLKSNSGVMGGWTIGSTTLSATGIILDAGNQKIQIGATAPITIDGALKEIESDNYTSGVFGAGFHLDSNLFEVGNIACRGLIRTAVFQKDVVNVMGGNFAVLDGDVLDADMTSLDLDNADGAVMKTRGDTMFYPNDILRIKDGIDDEWLQVADTSELIDSYSYLNKNSESGAADWYYGQSFQNPTPIKLTKCSFYLKKIGSPTGNIYAYLYAHTGTFGVNGTPTGSALATSDPIAISTIGTSFATVDFFFRGVNSYSMSAANYFIIISHSAGDGSNYVAHGTDTTSPTVSGNRAFTNTAALPTWFSQTATATIFYVYGIPASESDTYTVVRDKASAYPVDTNPAWKKGATVVNYKQSGDGGVYMTASETNAPYVSIFDHAGSPWTTINTRLRIGNLNGYLGYSTDLYGIAIGESTKYLKYDTTNGLRIAGAITASSIDIGTDGWHVDTSGNMWWGSSTTYAGATLRVSSAGVAELSGATISGTINATAGKFGTSTNYWNIGSTGLTAVSASTDVIINYGKTDFGQDSTNGFIIGYDYSASKSKIEFGSSSSKLFKYDGTDITLTGGTVTSGTIQTASSGRRVLMSGSNNRLSIINSSSTEIAYFGGTGNGNCIYISQTNTSEDYPPVYITSTQSSNVLNCYNTNSSLSNRPAFRFQSNNSSSEAMYINQTGNYNALTIQNNSSYYAPLYLIQGGSGVIIATNVAGCYLTKSGIWTDASSKTLKENFESLSVLDKVKQLDILKYNYKVDAPRNKDKIKEDIVAEKKKRKYEETEEGKMSGAHSEEHLKQKLSKKELDEIDAMADEESIKENNKIVEKHFTPMAEDFHEIFGVGNSQGISPSDVAGVALQAIKELAEEVELIKTKLKK